MKYSQFPYNDTLANIYYPIKKINIVSKFTNDLEKIKENITETKIINEE
jgi:hypothetical protein